VGAGVAAAKAVFPPVDSSKPFDFERHCELAAWAPTVDGAILPEQPLGGAGVWSAKTPLLVGSTVTEFGVGFHWPEFNDFRSYELIGRLTKAYGKEKGARVLEAFRRDHPGAKPCELFAILASSGVHRAAVRHASLKAAQGAGAVYSYLFAWNTPVLDGRIRSFHCAELPFVFDNTDRCDQATGGGAAARALAARVSEAWIRFARTGDPNHRELPAWPAYTGQRRATMVFDNTCTVVEDWGREGLAAVAAG